MKKYSTKRHILFYEFEKLWLFLTLLNLIAIFFIVRGSTLPLISDNKIIKFLFYSSETSDKTLYNISISYFAAYIFYMIQVYYPEKKRTEKALVSMELPVLNLINQTNMFLFVWDQYTVKNDPADGTILNVNIKTIYYKNDPDHAMRADKEELKNISKRVKEDYDEIVNSSTFQFCDNALKQLVLEINIPEEINILYQTLLSAELLSKNEGSTIMETYSEEIIYDIQERLKKLDNLLATNCNFDYSITEDINDIKQRDMLDLIALQTVAENFGYFSELPQSYKDSLK